MEIPGLDVRGSPPLSAKSHSKNQGEEDLTHYRVIRFIQNAGVRLCMTTQAVAGASHLYHRVFTVCSLGDCDPYLIGTTCLYLGSKVEEEPKRLRDVINVSYRTLHKDKPALDIGSNYWSLKESIIQCELFVMRLLKFQVIMNHPHKYLLHYITSLNSWLPPETVAMVPYTNTSWALLKDSYHGNVSLHYPANEIAIAVLYLSLQCHGITVPYNDEADTRWWQVFVEDLKLTDIRKIIHQILDVYDTEKLVDS